MKRIIALVAAVIMMLSLAGCDGPVSHYKAVAFVHSETSSSSFMSFMSFSGTMVFKMKCREGERIDYSAKLESGSAVVSCECGGVRKELFSVEAGEEVSSSLGYQGVEKLYIIVETTKDCGNGDFRFDVEKAG